MPDVVFTAYSNFNPSRYELRFGTFRAAVDFGAGFDDEQAQQLAWSKPWTNGSWGPIGRIR